MNRSVPFSYWTKGKWKRKIKNRWYLKSLANSGGKKITPHRFIPWMHMHACMCACMYFLIIYTGNPRINNHNRAFPLWLKLVTVVNWFTHPFFFFNSSCQANSVVVMQTSGLLQAQFCQKPEVNARFGWNCYKTQSCDLSMLQKALIVACGWSPEVQSHDCGRSWPSSEIRIQVVDTY